MTRQSQISRRDLEQLSTYLDGALSARETARLEARLHEDPILRHALDELRETIRLVGSLPEAKVPRNFTLTPEMVGIKERPRAYPVMRLATALATLAFLVVVGVDAITSTMFLRAAAPAAKEQIALEAPSYQANAFREAEVPAEGWAAVETEAVHLESEAEVGEEVRGDEDAFDLAQPTMVPGEYKGVTDTPTEDELAESRALAPTSTLESVAGEPLPAIEEEAVGGVIAEETSTPSSIVDAIALTTDTPSPDLVEPVGAQPWSPLRIAEVGLGVVATILAVLTIWIRKRS
jgi:hypothetical protein